MSDTKRVREDVPVLRPVTPADRSSLIALALAEDAAFSGAGEVSEEEVGEMIDAFRPGMVFERDGRVVGYGSVRDGGETSLLVDPDDALPAIEALVGWFTEQGYGSVESYAADTQRIAWLEEHGFSYQRSFYDLARGGDPVATVGWPEGIEVVDYRPGADDDEVYRLVYDEAAWAEVPGHREQSQEAWRASFATGYNGWVARRDGRPVGWVAGRVFPDGRGWVEQIAVAKSARRTGLGRALLIHALTELLDAGATSFALGVQADNESALGLYRAVGFEVEREWRVYVRSPASADGPE